MKKIITIGLILALWGSGAQAAYYSKINGISTGIASGSIIKIDGTSIGGESGNVVSVGGVGMVMKTGTVAQAASRLSCLANTSFIDFGAANTLTLCNGCKLAYTDAAGKTISGYIGADGTEETYYTAIGGATGNGNFETGSPPASWNAGDACSLARVADERTGGSGSYSMEITQGATAVAWAARQALASPAGKLYRFDGYAKKALGSVGYLVFEGTSYAATSATTTSDSWTALATKYRTGHASYTLTMSAFTSTTEGGTNRVDDFQARVVNSPADTGTYILSTLGGSNGWANEESGFDRNSTSYSYTITTK